MNSRLALVTQLLAAMPFLACAGHADPPPATPSDPPVVSAAAPAERSRSHLRDDHRPGRRRNDFSQRCSVTDEALQRAARAAHDANPDLRVVIHAEATVTHGRTVAVLDLLKQAGVTKFALAPAGATP